MIHEGAQPDGTVFHILRGGVTLCGFGRGAVPRDWPEGHKWMDDAAYRLSKAPPRCTCGESAAFVFGLDRAAHCAYYCEVCAKRHEGQQHEGLHPIVLLDSRREKMCSGCAERAR
jgi:hypothetical protein